MRALAGLDVAQQLDEPVGALAAGRALAAGLVGVELGPAGDGPHHAGRLVEALQRLGAEHGAGGADALVVQRDVEVLVGEHRGRGAARRPELQPVAGPHAAAHVEQLAQRDAERGLVLAGAGDVAAERVEREARGLLAAHRPEPVLALVAGSREPRRWTRRCSPQWGRRRGPRPRGRAAAAGAGRGGPSSESSSAVSSPQMYAPAPACTVSSRSRPLPRMFLPR